MWTSRDVALVIMLSVGGFIYSSLVGQIGLLLTGIPGVNYFFTVGHAIFVSLGFLLFEGRRWRFALQTTIFSILTLPTYLMGTPYDILTRMPLILTGFQADLLFNSVYKAFKQRKKIVLWAIIGPVEFFILDPFLRILTYPLFLPQQYTSTFTHVTLILLPIIVIEAAIGGYIGWKIHQRLRKFG